jgi:hypothetical protein
MLNKKVALPWGLFGLSAMYTMMRPCTKVSKCDNSTAVEIKPYFVQSALHHVYVPEQVHGAIQGDRQVHGADEHKVHSDEHKVYGAEQVHGSDQVHSDEHKVHGADQVHYVAIQDENNVHYVAIQDDHPVHYVVPDERKVHVLTEEVVHHVRHRSYHPKESTDEHPSTGFVMLVTLLIYVFIKVVFVPPRGYKKYI